jgi:hypothetical protein
VVSQSHHLRANPITFGNRVLKLLGFAGHFQRTKNILAFLSHDLAQLTRQACTHVSVFTAARDSPSLVVQSNPIHNIPWEYVFEERKAEEKKAAAEAKEEVKAAPAPKPKPVAPGAFDLSSFGFGGDDSGPWGGGGLFPLLSVHADWMSPSFARRH